MRELRERAEPGLRILCYILAAVVVFELAGMIIRWNPFRGAVVPPLPTLTAATNSPSGGAHTNLMAGASGKGTNGSPHLSSTNSALPMATGKTNSIPLPLLSENKTNNGTNLISHVVLPMTGTNLAGISVTNKATNATTIITTNLGTNVVAKMKIEFGPINTNTAMVSTNGGTNMLLSAAAGGTNAAPDAKPKKKKSSGGSVPDMAGMPGMPGMGFNPFGPPGKPGADLPPAMQARISRIVDSEILGPVMHPLPMALLGIAGNLAFLRVDSGQTGLVKEGDSLDDIKVLRIGVNRVLIEQNGQKKELTIFSGYGSESLLQNDSTNENKHL